MTRQSLVGIAYGTLLALGFASALACSSGDDDDAVATDGEAAHSAHDGGPTDASRAGPTRDWEDVLGGESMAAYSLAFYPTTPASSSGPSPDDFGTFALGALFFDAEAGGCELYQRRLGSSSNDRDDFWVLRLELGIAAAGSFPIVINARHPVTDPDGFAAARLERWRDGEEVERHVAVAGHVTVDEITADPASWPAARVLSGEARLEFPRRNLQTLSCGSIMAPAGTGEQGQARSCECLDEDGERSTCEATNEVPDCCHDLTAERVAVDVPFQADPCPEMCQASALVLYSKCRALGEP